MVTVFRAHGLRVIFANDHEPAHVFGDGEAKIDLLGIGGGPELIWAQGMIRAAVRCAVRIVGERQAILLARWRDIHG